MKLEMIESPNTVFAEAWYNSKALDNTIYLQQSAKDLVYIALKKIRDMLGTMGLNKHTSRIIEPNASVIELFLNIRTIVQTKAKRDAKILLSGVDHERISKFWGIQLPHINNTYSQFDNLIKQTVDASRGQPTKIKIELLCKFASSI